MGNLQILLKRTLAHENLKIQLINYKSDEQFLS